MKRSMLTILAFCAIACCGQAAWAEPVYRHVLLISVDGLHAADLADFVSANPHSSLALLGDHGVTYAEASAPTPSDSFPGLLAMVTGGSPATTGVFYDNSYDRRLSPPGSACKIRGSAVLYDEAIDGQPVAGHEGAAAIDAGKLPLDPDRGCTPVYPHTYLRVNTVFEVVHGHGGLTAWADKHPAYDILNGPSGKGVDELYTPEIGANGEGKISAGLNGITGSLARTIRYDATKVQAVLNEIRGLDYSGVHRRGVPALFGMNFQALNVAQKLPAGGYRDHGEQPSAEVNKALQSIDGALGEMLAALRKAGVLEQTLVIISAKSGNGPLDRHLTRLVDKTLVARRLEERWPGSVAHITTDDVALVWLIRPALASQARDLLLADADSLGIKRVYLGSGLYGTEPGDARTPDLVIVPHSGVIYAPRDAQKIAEHGGFGHDDTHVALLVSTPGSTPEHRSVAAPVSAMQIAPTILQALGLKADELKAVRLERTQPLPLW